MPTPSNEIQSLYRQALLVARDRGYRINRQGVERLYAAFAEALSRISSEAGTQALTAERAAGLRQDIEQILRALQKEMARSTETSVRDVLLDVVQLHREVNRELIRRYGAGTAAAASVAGRFDRVPVRALQAMVARSRGAATFRTLYNRKITALAPQLDTFLDAAVTRGVSAGRAAKDLAQLMVRAGGTGTNVADSRAFARALDAVDVGDLHRGAGTIDFDAYGLTDNDVSELRKLLYDARRIQVSETNNALREGNAASMRESPIVAAAAWQLSGRHPEPDVCDVLAETDAFGYGPGFYPPDRWPLAPHPHCGCTAGRVLHRRPSEWDQPKPSARPLEIDPGDSRVISRWSDRWTERQAERYQQQFTAILQETERFQRRAA